MRPRRPPPQKAALPPRGAPPQGRAAAPPPPPRRATPHARRRRKREIPAPRHTPTSTQVCPTLRTNGHAVPAACNLEHALGNLTWSSSPGPPAPLTPSSLVPLVCGRRRLTAATWITSSCCMRRPCRSAAANFPSKPGTLPISHASPLSSSRAAQEAIASFGVAARGGEMHVHEPSGAHAFTHVEACSSPVEPSAAIATTEQSTKLPLHATTATSPYAPRRGQREETPRPIARAPRRCGAVVRGTKLPRTHEWGPVRRGARMRV
jgi:hypothetical protein